MSADAALVARVGSWVRKALNNKAGRKANRERVEVRVLEKLRRTHPSTTAAQVTGYLDAALQRFPQSLRQRGANVVLLEGSPAPPATVDCAPPGQLASEESPPSSTGNNTPAELAAAAAAAATPAAAAAGGVDAADAAASELPAATQKLTKKKKKREHHTQDEDDEEQQRQQLKKQRKQEKQEKQEKKKHKHKHHQQVQQEQQEQPQQQQHAPVSAPATSTPAAAGSDGGRPKRKRTPLAPAAAAAASSDADDDEYDAAPASSGGSSGGGRGRGSGGGGSNSKKNGRPRKDTIESWRGDFNRTDVKHGAFDEQEKAEVQHYVTQFARQRGLPDQPGTCDWLLDLKTHNITKNTLSEEVYDPCLPHRVRKAVWQFVQRVYPPFKRGPWTADEDATLRAKVAERGNKWKEIGQLLGRSAESVADRWRNLNQGKARKTGRWSENELNQLAALVQEYKTTFSQAVCEEDKYRISANLVADKDAERRRKGLLTKEDVDWAWVSDGMQDRSAKQCAEKWYTSLDEGMVSRGQWAPGQDGLLVQRLKTALDGGAREWEVAWEALIEGRTDVQCIKRWEVLRMHLPADVRYDLKKAVAEAARRFQKKASKAAPKPAAAAAAAAAAAEREDDEEEEAAAAQRAAQRRQLAAAAAAAAGGGGGGARSDDDD